MKWIVSAIGAVLMCVGVAIGVILLMYGFGTLSLS